MRNKNKYFRLLSVMLVLCLISAMANFSVKSAAAQELSNQDEKTLIEQRIKELNNKLNALDKKSADTEEYLKVLNEKINYLKKELDSVSNEVQEDKERVNDLKDKYEKNEKEIESSKIEIEELTKQLSESQINFSNNFDLYCKRLSVMYVSGQTSLLSFLIESKDISELLTRYEMINRVSQQDSKLLKEIRAEMDGIKSSKNEIVQKTDSLSQKQTELKKTTADIENSILDLQEKQISLDKKRTSLSEERAQANVLLKKLGDEKGIYTEYLEDDKKTLDEIDRALEEAEKEYVSTTSKTTTVKTTSTTASSEKPEGSGSTAAPTATKPPTTSGSNSGKYISLTYPVPSQKKVTCSFYDYVGHSGCDFSCPTGSKVVAAESGTVIISTDLKNDDGSYRSYGRYIVIMHDKTTKSGGKVYTLYAHNSERLVTAGTYVEKGQQIAKSGSTGNSTGPHCHFEVRTPSSAYSDCKDPQIYLP